MYIKDKKTIENRYGIRSVKENENPFENPCIITFLPQKGIRFTNGYFNKILDLLQLNYDQHQNGDVDLSQIELSLVNDETGRESVEKILSIIPCDDKEKAKEAIKNITIFSYCAGHNLTYIFINHLFSGLIDKGYSEKDVKQILAQLAVLQVVDNFEKKTFPYVTSVICHDVYDVENLEWMNSSVFTTDSYSKMAILSNESKNCSFVVNNSFGEGSLKANFPEEHSFKEHYCNSPVLNAMMSLCLLNSVSRSNIEKDINAMSLLEGSEVILRMAEDYEKKSVDLDGLSSKELLEFKNIFNPIINEYLKRKIKIGELEPKEKCLSQERLEVLGTLNNMGLYSINLHSINSMVNRIMYYYTNYNKDDIVDIRVGNSVLSAVKVGEFIDSEIKNLLFNLKELIDYLKNIVLPDSVSIEIRKELAEYKRKIIDQILTPSLRTIISEYQYTTSIIYDVSDDMKL